MKQGSIEWLAERARFINKEFYAELFDYIQQAKEMHKAEIADAYSSGKHQQTSKGEAEDYYNETFNTKL